jgi:CRP/FNR family transcriptional regulator, cyclic AMP receptor protein
MEKQRRPAGGAKVTPPKAMIPASEPTPSQRTVDEALRPVALPDTGEAGLGADAPRLARFDLFEGVDDDTLRRVGRHCRWRRYRAGETVVERDESSREMFLIAEGSVRVATDGAQDRDVTFADIGVGAYFGELAAIDGLPRTATVRAVEDTLLLVMPHETVVSLLQGNGAVAFRVLQRLTQVIRFCDDRITAFATLNAMQRVYAELLRLAVPDAAVRGLWVVRPCPTENEIASRTSATRKTVDRAIRQLRQSGLVRRKGHNLYILDRGRLETVARTTDRRGG